MGLPPLPTLPPVEGVIDELHASSHVTGGEGGVAINPIGGANGTACVLFERNAKCGIGAVGNRTLSFRRNQVRAACFFWLFFVVVVVASSPLSLSLSLSPLLKSKKKFYISRVHVVV